jgi:hypothetical protein
MRYFFLPFLYLRIWWGLIIHHKMINFGLFYYYRYNCDPGGWNIRIGKVLSISRFGNKKYIETNKGYRYAIVILGKLYRKGYTNERR